MTGTIWRLVEVRRWQALPLLVGSALAAFPFLFHLAGDAQVHLAVAERFAVGEPFRYNPGGEVVVASTSPFWTLTLTLYYLIVGPLTPLLLKVIVLFLWLGSGYLLVESGLRQWRLGRRGGWALAFLWLTHATIVANALSGLENILSALQLLLLYQLADRYREEVTPGRLATLGLLWGWMVLTRLDGGLLGAVVLFLFFRYRRYQEPSFGRFMQEAAVVALAALFLNMPWYLYQYQHTGQLLSDSALARLYGGRQGSVVLVPHVLYLHPKTVISLATAFFPLSLGGLVFLGARLKAPRRWRERRFAETTAIALVVVGLLFFTFGVGAEAFGRYFLPIFPFFFLVGVAGWQILLPSLSGHSQRLAHFALAGAILFLVGTSSLDYYRRTVTGRFLSGPVLNVIYGPANRQYFAYNLVELIRAPSRRTAATDELLAALGAESTTHIAVTEVQLRYFVDERVRVVSLDGRTSAEILSFINPESGIPDFGAYFQFERPDYVHVNQWCRVGGWLRILSTSTMTNNLICTWQKELLTLNPGATFNWQGRTVRYVAPEIVEIEWE